MHTKSSHLIIKLSANLLAEHTGKRLDQVLAKLFPEHSRSRIKAWIDKGYVRVNGLIKKPKDLVSGDEHVEIEAFMEVLNEDTNPEKIPLDIIYEDEEILLINKPAGLVVHPAYGNRSGTLVNALLHHCPKLSYVPRAGIVHRLDKDTTGLMVVAKTVEAHTKLVEQLRNRSISRSYETIVHGVLTSGGTIETFMGRHPKDRTRMSVLETGKTAVTHYRIIQRFKHHCHLLVRLETGRTHQIRVHMAYIKHPIVGDKLYGGRLRLPPKASEALVHSIKTFSRQALHAKRLEITHPKTDERLSFEVPLPKDFQNLLGLLI